MRNEEKISIKFNKENKLFLKKKTKFNKKYKLNEFSNTIEIYKMAFKIYKKLKSYKLKLKETSKILNKYEELSKNENFIFIDSSETLIKKYHSSLK